MYIIIDSLIPTMWCGWLSNEKGREWYPCDISDFDRLLLGFNNAKKKKDKKIH